jgi:hypothetical protein
LLVFLQKVRCFFLSRGYVMEQRKERFEPESAA